MAYASKGEQRIEGSTNYKASERTLNSDGYERESDMGKSSEKIWGRTGSGKSASLSGKTGTRSAESKLVGKMTGAGYSGGKKGK